MRYPLITPLASRDGTVDKDERLVNCFGEQDDETKETRVIKRAGIDEGDAVIGGNDIYGQGVFSYGGYLFAMIDDILGYWVYVSGGTMYGSGGGGGGTYFNESFIQDYDVSTTYDIGDAVIQYGQKLYSQMNGNVGNATTTDVWDESEPGLSRYKGYLSYNGSFGAICSTKDAAAYAAWSIYPYNACDARDGFNNWQEYIGIMQGFGDNINTTQFNGNCSSSTNQGQSSIGYVVTI